MLATVGDNIVDQQETSKSYEKLTRIRRILINGAFFYGKLQFNESLELDGDVNYQMPDNGNTALHFAVEAATFQIDQNKKILQQLIDHGADPTIANNQGQTPVHVAAGVFENLLNRFMARPYIRDILPIVHIRNGNTTNFKDIYGLSHFHAACMINDLEIVEFFLKNGVSVDEAVAMDSPQYPGYTSLRFAAEFGSDELVNTLMDHGANLTIDSSGMSPLHVPIRRNMEIIQHMSLYRIQACNDLERGIVVNEGTVLAELAANEKIITSIVSKTKETVMHRVDLFPFYVMRTLKNGSVNWTRNDINECIPMDSSFWPGYTALHFAAHFDIDTVKLLLERGAYIEAKDAYAVTPFDLCVGRYSVEDIHSIISSHSTWRNVLLSDGKTKLLELVLAMREPEDLAKLLAERDINEIFVPRDPPLWPGFGVLHLAATLSKKRMHYHVGTYRTLFDGNREIRASESIEACLRLGADVVAQDRDGSTPIHLAFRRMDLENMYFLLERYTGNSNPTDKDNLSLLHIACAVEDENLVRELLSTGADPNAALSSSFQWDPELRYFHDLSSDEQLHVWPGSTPLHVATTTQSKTIVKLLLEAGANLDAKDAYGLTPVHRLLMLLAPCKDKMEYDDLLSRLVSRDCAIDGLSYLHVAAHRGYPKFLDKLLSLGADMNSRLAARERVTMEFPWSFIPYKRKAKFAYFFNNFEGNTPLHMALDRTYLEGDIPRKLISSGADVLAKNSRGISPICKILKKKRLLKCYASAMSDDDEKRAFVEMGLTRLHVACRLCDAKMMEKCLKRGANANARIRDDSGIWRGFTPLHVVVDSYSPRSPGVNKRRHGKEMCRMVRLLLNAGADVTIADAKGETPLMMNVHDNHIHMLRRPAHMNILWKALRSSSVNPVSDQGLSHFHLACIRSDAALVERFLKLGANPNQTVHYYSDKFPGYTPLHFAVCHVLRGLICSDLPILRTVDLLLRYGANVNAMDVDNNTPLHLAAEYPSLAALPYKRLFWAGADPEAKNLYDLAPSNLLFNVENGEAKQFFSECCRFGGRCLLNKLVSPFGGCTRCFRRVYDSKVRKRHTHCKH